MITDAATVECSDCIGVQADGGWVGHVATCPHLRAARERAAWDLLWLSGHPEEQGRFRALAPSERGELRAAGAHLTQGAIWRALVVVREDGGIASAIFCDGRHVANLVVFLDE